MFVLCHQGNGTTPSDYSKPLVICAISLNEASVASSRRTKPAPKYHPDIDGNMMTGSHTTKAATLTSTSHSTAVLGSGDFRKP